MYAFPVLYMKRVAETGNKNVKPDQMLSDIRKNVGKWSFSFWNAIHYHTFDAHYDGDFVFSNDYHYWIFLIDFVDAGVC
jgi:hypothetical protein